MEAASLFERRLLLPAVRDSFVKLDPRMLIGNPVMFTTAIVAVLATAMFVRNRALAWPARTTSPCANRLSSRMLEIKWSEIQDPRQRY